jgi:hypothetical protein
MRTAGHYDHTARMADTGRDGVAAGGIFHGSENGELIPFERRIMGRRRCRIRLANLSSWPSPDRSRRAER